MYQPAASKDDNGFTLLELSIVLAIIGLIIGAVLVGRDLIRASEIRSVISDVDKIKSAVNTFKLKFNALPGDILNATDYGLGTNGNGNGSIDVGFCNAGSQDTSTAGNIEPFLFWQHLGNANLIPGNFTGQPGPANAIDAIINVNVPPSKVQNSGYAIFNVPSGSASTCAGSLFTNANYTNYIIFGAQKTGQALSAPILTPFEAYSIDQKIDDGLPVSGHVVTLNSSYFSSEGFGATNCVTSNNSVTATYNLSYKGLGCHLYFNRAF